MNPVIDEDNDVVFFPFPQYELGRDLSTEAWAYRNANLNCWDADDIGTAGDHDWGDTGRLIIYGHGSDKPADAQYIYAKKDRTVTPPALAEMIRKMGFPKGAEHEIIVWACHSGPVGRFAQLLTLHLINEGYVGKKVWGCNRFGGTIDQTQKCLKASDREEAIPHRASDADASYYIGTGAPLQRL